MNKKGTDKGVFTCPFTAFYPKALNFVQCGRSSDLFCF